MQSGKQPKRPPVILLAFANEHDERPLEHLQHERDLLQEALEPLERDGLCKLVVEPIATLDRITKRLAEFGSRVRVFHFAGHAAARVLKFEKQDGSSTSIDATGFARLLASGEAPDIVFLNGCSSAEQARELLNEGVLAVIGTTDAIDDNVATRMSAHFYQRIAANASIREAFDFARHRHSAEFGDDHRHAYRSIEFEDEGGSEPDGWPWELHARPNDRDRVENWSIRGLQNAPSDAADVTLLGYMCDRREQIDWLVNTALPRQDQSSPNRPLGLIVHGPLGEAHTEFLRRLQEWDLPRYLQAQTGVARSVKLVSIDWNNSIDALRRELAIEIAGNEEATVDEIQRSIIESRESTIIETTVGTREWGASTPDTVKEWFDLFEGFGDLPSGQLLLPVVMILEKKSEDGRFKFWKSGPEKFVRRFGSSHSITEPLPRLEPVPMEAVTDEWLREDFAEQAKDLIDEVRMERNFLVARLRPFVKDLYRREAKDALPMEDIGDPLAAEIQSILQDVR